MINESSPSTGQTVNVNEKPLPDRTVLKSDAAELMDKAKVAGKEQTEYGKRSVASQAEKLAAVVEQTSAQFRDNDMQTLAEYTSEIGSTIKNFSENLRSRSVEDLVNDTREIARKNPAVFVLGSIAVGVAVGRFFKASAQRPQEPYRNEAGDGGVTHEDRVGASIGDT